MLSPTPPRVHTHPLSSSSSIAAGSTKGAGFSVIELLVVVGVIGVLATLVLYGVGASKNKARDNVIRNAVRQLRWEAEIVYDSKGGSYRNWSTAPEIQEQLDLLKAAIDTQYGTAGQYVLCDGQRQDFCASAPLRAEAGHYCIDATGKFEITSDACNCAPEGSPPPALRCVSAS